MRFLIDTDSIRYPKRPSAKLSYPVIVLLKDNWDDYSYKTTCEVFIFLTHESEPIRIGSTRIMKLGQEKGEWSLSKHRQVFRMFTSEYCSLSPEMDYYKKIRELGQEFGIRYLRLIRDAAFTRQVWRNFEDDSCFETSLLREGSSLIKIRDSIPKLFGRQQQFIRSFTYSIRLPGAKNEHQIYFDFNRKSLLPHRIYLLVGRNGVGKTQLLANLAIALSGVTAEEYDEDTKALAYQKRRSAGTVRPIPSFYGVIAVSFNAFDNFEIPSPPQDALIPYTYCGIRKNDGTLCVAGDYLEKIKTALAKMDSKQKRLLRICLRNIFGIVKSKEIINLDERYNHLSAGQRIVFNVVTHLIANLDMRSLVLLDEPETHLHPDLMATLISEIGRILEARRSYAIIASHSPIIAQQIPSRSIRVITRNENIVETMTPDIECFGENLSEISSALFDSPEFKRDYTDVINELLAEHDNDPKSIEALFEKGIGSNGRAYLWSLSKSIKKKKRKRPK